MLGSSLLLLSGHPLLSEVIIVYPSLGCHAGPKKVPTPKISPTLKILLLPNSLIMNNQSSINRSSTPDFDDHNCNQEYSTPIKAKVQAVVEFNDAHKILYLKKTFFVISAWNE